MPIIIPRHPEKLQYFHVMQEPLYHREAFLRGGAFTAQRFYRAGTCA